MTLFHIGVGILILIVGLFVGYKYSKNKNHTLKVPPQLQGNLQKFGESGFMDVPLGKVTKITHDTFIFSYILPDPDLSLGLHVGQHIAVYADIKTQESPEGEEIRRKYTPISKVEQRGTFELLIKVYRKDTHPKFPEGGMLSQYLETLNIGDKIKISGPLGSLSYHGQGKTLIKREKNIQSIHVKEFGLIAGGTGIAPMYQVIKAILDNPDDKTIVHLLFGNKSEEDLLMKPELDAIEADPRFKIHYTLDIAPAGWKGFTGFVTKEMLQKTMPYPGKGTLICTCGPGPMTRMLGIQLGELGYAEDSVFKF